MSDAPRFTASTPSKTPGRARRLAKRTALASLLVASALSPLGAQADWPLKENQTVVDAANPLNWPNDPGYGYDEDSDGQWNYYSFMVTPNMARPEEKSTGMSIDLAWRYTTGDRRVVIAITDSGIEWDSRDVVEAAYLNAAELATHKPLHADSSPCGGVGDLAGFDCNGDEEFTVSDYAETPTLTPLPTDGHPLGDRNQNGVLDAGDIISNFSDGIDDDMNGYVDDISGWDWMKDDNDPYDDTRYGHGTGEANDSMARANNGMGNAGACPHCRLMPMRVGDSFITDVTEFGQAVIYATDNGASLIQSALGTVNNNVFAQKALDYAYEHGVLTIASMADENSRHHNMPTAANHTLPVHAIQYSGDDVHTARTFLQFHPCSNYGGQNFLSASGRSCSSEATGQLSGITGLVYSAGLKYMPAGGPLTAGEVQQLLMLNADDIDVPESQQPEPVDKWSQPGFDQRFGYGRVNANASVEAVKDGRIPPVVDITSPTWFSVFHKDRVLMPIDVLGTISAKRATGYDYVAEWAPGVQPLDGEFVVFASQTNVPPATVIGADGPIGSLDVRNIDPKHERDADSPLGENDYTITVRVRAVAHYGGAIGDVPGELRRTYYVHEDPDVMKGFPIYIGSGGEGSPKMADIDGDGLRDILYPTAGGELHVYKITPDGPVELPGFPFKADRADGMLSPPYAPGVPDYTSAPAYSGGGVDPDIAREALSTGAPAIADIDGDGKPEIVVTSYAGTVYIVESDGTRRPGWPVRMPRVPSCSLDPMNPTPPPCMGDTSHIARGAFAAPVLEDMNKDGRLDIVQAGFDGNIYVWDIDGTLLPGFPVGVAYTGPLVADLPPPNRIFTTPAVGDFTGDGIPEILVGSNQKLSSGGGSGAIYLVDGRGTLAPTPYLPNWPITLTSLNLFPLVAEGITNAGVIGTFDGTLAAVQHGNASPPLILPLDPGKQTGLNQTPVNALPVRPDPNDPSKMLHGVDFSSNYGSISKAPQPDTMLPLFSQPALGDIDQDGVPDVIASGGSLSLATSLQSSESSNGANLISMWSGKTGVMLPASPMLLEDFTFLNSSAVADITGDGYPEVLIGSGGYYLHAYDGCGREPEGWPKFTGQWIIPTPAVGDVDGDDKLDVVVGTRDGWLYAWNTDAPTTNVVEWESYHHDNRNTGNYDVKLEQGGPRTATTPLVAAMCEDPVPPPPNNYTVSGGCDCSIDRPADARGGWIALGVFGVGLGVAVRRRRRDAARLEMGRS